MTAESRDEAELVRQSAREFLARECPGARVREIAANPGGHDPTLWKQLAELGWLGFVVPEEDGGLGLAFDELVPLLEETGRALLPLPFLPTLWGALLLAHTESPRRAELAAVAGGQRVLTLAVTEAGGDDEPSDVALEAREVGNGLELSGSKLFVPHAAAADAFLVLTRTGASADDLTWAYVERDASGLELRALRGMDTTRPVFELSLADTPGDRVGALHGGGASWHWLRDRILATLALEAVGGSERVLEMAVAYAQEREQFGRPIGANQAIQHKCADMFVELESARLLARAAARALAADAPDSPTAAAMAKAYCADAYRTLAAENIQIHGGVGYTWEYDCHLYYKRARATQLTFGDTRTHHTRIADQLLSPTGCSGRS
ncbi:MAG: acyl-CoA/acyl-ACP dehydrogenase [Proteobacteria bacterium]|nr:acyl-CoA/acyl-ACP dehydrogenase [Pseudomonadota bacterium]